RSMLRTDFFISNQKRSNPLRLGRACSRRSPTFVEPKTMETDEVIFHNISDPPLGKKIADLKFQLGIQSDATRCRLQCYGEKIAESRSAASFILSAKDSHKEIIRYINSRVRRNHAYF